MLEASLVLCALAGIAAAVGIKRYRRPDTREIGLEVERSILAKCIEHLEQPEYAIERNILYKKYQRRLEHVNDTLAGKKSASDMSAKDGERKEQKTKGMVVATKSGDKKAEVPKEAVASRGQKTKTVIKDPVHSQDVKTGKGDTDTAPATKVAPIKPPEGEQKGKIKDQGKKAGIGDTDTAPATKVAPIKPPEGEQKGKIKDQGKKAGIGDTDTAPATKVAPIKPPEGEQKGKIKDQVKKAGKKIHNKPAGIGDTDTAPATKVAPIKPPEGEQKGKIKDQVKKAGKNTSITRRPAPKAPVHDTSPKQIQDGVSQTVKRPAAESADVKDIKSEKVEKDKVEQVSKGQGTDNVETQEDLEKIKNDIRRALSKLEQVEAD